MSKNVFISWSGKVSHKVAQLLYTWLPRFIQSIKPFLSSEDIRKGVRWFNEISGELEQINFGIVCITPDNMNAPWILFEGGALSKSLGQSRVTPLLINVSNSDLQGPLAQFNTTSLTEEDIKRLIQSINIHLGEKGISSDLLEDIFEICWPSFEKQLNEVLADTEISITAPSTRSQSDILDELLKLTRSISQEISAERTERLDISRLLGVASPKEAAKLFEQLGELKDKGREQVLLDTISHELLASIVGIRSNASFLQMRMQTLPVQMVETKLNDILTDCELLLFQVNELKYILGHTTTPPSKVESVLVFRDIILKTINQLQPILREQGFNASNIVYDKEDIHRIRIFIHKARLQQVVFNLLINSIKYAEDNPDDFRIRIVIDETKDAFIIKFQDWGIGIATGFEQKIFEQGFRAPEAVKKNVSGAGLGLTIAKKIMIEIGGDLILSNNHKPTEFQIVLPKTLKEAPNDTVR